MSKRSSRRTFIAEGKHYVKEVLAKLTQDGDKAIAEGNARIAIQSTVGQLSALDLKLMTAETTVDKAVKGLNEAKFRTTAILSPESYLEGIKDAKFALDTAKEAKKVVEDSIDFFEDLLEEYTQDVAPVVEGKE